MSNNPESGFDAVPEETRPVATPSATYIASRVTLRRECDMLVGPCACGATHTRDTWKPEEWAKGKSSEAATPPATGEAFERPLVAGWEWRKVIVVDAALAQSTDGRAGK